MARTDLGRRNSIEAGHFPMQSKVAPTHRRLELIAARIIPTSSSVLRSHVY